MTEEDIQKFEKGLDLGDFITQSANLEILEVHAEISQTLIHVEITEGKFHQVKRMFEAVGKEVIQLHRISMGPLKIDPELALGDYRELTEAEMNLLVPYGLE